MLVLYLATQKHTFLSGTGENQKGGGNRLFILLKVIIRHTPCISIPLATVHMAMKGEAFPRS